VASAILLAQSAALALPAAWLGVAVYDNLRHARLNAGEFARALRMHLVREETAIYREVGHRRVTARRSVRRLYRLLVAVQIATVLLLWLAALSLLLAAVGGLSPVSARGLALLAMAAFTAIWGAFLIGGEWFWYRIGLVAAQWKHFYLLIWGLATLAFLAA